MQSLDLKYLYYVFRDIHGADVNIVNYHVNVTIVLYYSLLQIIHIKQYIAKLNLKLHLDFITSLLF